MRLLGYPSSKISILTTYAGQRQLIKDVLHRRCFKNPLFGMPSCVTTVDKYQGEQNDCRSPSPLSTFYRANPNPRPTRLTIIPISLDIILSLTRTTKVGYLRDIRRLTVALSRARLGLYIVGRREVFEACYELRDAFRLLLGRPDKLVLVTGEMWPSERVLADEADDDKDARYCTCFGEESVKERRARWPG